MRLRLLHLLRLQGAASYLLPLGQRHCGCMSAAHQEGTRCREEGAAADGEGAGEQTPSWQVQDGVAHGVAHGVGRVSPRATAIQRTGRGLAIEKAEPTN